MSLTTIKTVIVIYIVNRICNILFHFALSCYNLITNLSCNLPRPDDLIGIYVFVIIIGTSRERNYRKHGGHNKKQLFHSCNKFRLSPQHQRDG